MNRSQISLFFHRKHNFYPSVHPYYAYKDTNTTVLTKVIPKCILYKSNLKIVIILKYKGDELEDLCSLASNVAQYSVVRKAILFYYLTFFQTNSWNLLINKTFYFFKHFIVLCLCVTAAITTDPTKFMHEMCV